MFTEAQYIDETEVMAKAFNGTRWLDYCPTDPSRNHHKVSTFIGGGGTMPSVDSMPTPSPVNPIVAREHAYRSGSDKLYLLYIGQLLDASGNEGDAVVAAAKQDWIDQRQAIKTLYPKQ